MTTQQRDLDPVHDEPIDVTNAYTERDVSFHDNPQTTPKVVKTQKQYHSSSASQVPWKRPCFHLSSPCKIIDQRVLTSTKKHDSCSSTMSQDVFILDATSANDLNGIELPQLTGPDTHFPMVKYQHYHLDDTARPTKIQALQHGNEPMQNTAPSTKTQTTSSLQHEKQKGRGVSFLEWQQKFLVQNYETIVHNERVDRAIATLRCIINRRKDAILSFLANDAVRWTLTQLEKDDIVFASYESKENKYALSDTNAFLGRSEDEQQTLAESMKTQSIDQISDLLLAHYRNKRKNNDSHNPKHAHPSLFRRIAQCEIEDAVAEDPNLVRVVIL